MNPLIRFAAEQEQKLDTILFQRSFNEEETDEYHNPIGTGLKVAGAAGVAGGIGYAGYRANDMLQDRVKGLRSTRSGFKNLSPSGQQIGGAKDLASDAIHPAVKSRVASIRTAGSAGMETVKGHANRVLDRGRSGIDAAKSGYGRAISQDKSVISAAGRGLRSGVNAIARKKLLSARGSEIRFSEDERPEAGYWAKSMAATRASRRSHSGIGKTLASDELIGARTMHGVKHGLIGAGIGGGIGAAAGAVVARKAHVAGLGALIGASAGSGIGQIHGIDKADREYLGKRGIKQDFLGRTTLTPEAAGKYLHKKYRGGGYSSELGSIAHLMELSARLDDSINFAESSDEDNKDGAIKKAALVGVGSTAAGVAGYRGSQALARRYGVDQMNGGFVKKARAVGGGLRTEAEGTSRAVRSRVEETSKKVKDRANRSVASVRSRGEEVLKGGKKAVRGSLLKGARFLK